MLLTMLLQMHAHACAGMRGSRACLKMLLVRIVRGSCALARRRGREAHFAVFAGHGQSSAGRFFARG